MKVNVDAHLKILFVFAFAFLVQSCATNPINLGIAKEELIKYHDSGRYDQELTKVVNKAIDEFNSVKANNNSLVVFDVDETSLSNYEINKELDFGYVPELWDKWIQSAKAPAIKEVLKLYNYLNDRGIKIAFITGRKSYQYDATYKNLVDAGYKTFDTLIVRTANEDSLTAEQYKSKIRIELTQKGYDIIGDVGDQYSDLNGPDHGIQVKIPNYMYLIR
jgi:acid phosphatase